MILYVVIEREGRKRVPTVYFAKRVPANVDVIARRRVRMTSKEKPRFIDALAATDEGTSELIDLIDAGFALGCRYQRKVEEHRG